MGGLDDADVVAEPLRLERLDGAVVAELVERVGGEEAFAGWIKARIERAKAMKDGHLVYDLPLGLGEAEQTVCDIVCGHGQVWIAK